MDKCARFVFKGLGLSNFSHLLFSADFSSEDLVEPDYWTSFSNLLFSPDFTSKDLVYPILLFRGLGLSCFSHRRTYSILLISLAFIYKGLGLSCLSLQRTFHFWIPYGYVSIFKSFWQWIVIGWVVGQTYVFIFIFFPFFLSLIFFSGPYSWRSDQWGVKNQGKKTYLYVDWLCAYKSTYEWLKKRQTSRWSCPTFWETNVGWLCVCFLCELLKQMNTIRFVSVCVVILSWFLIMCFGVSI